MLPVTNAPGIPDSWSSLNLLDFLNLLDLPQASIWKGAR